MKNHWNAAPTPMTTSELIFCLAGAILFGIAGQIALKSAAVGSQTVAALRERVGAAVEDGIVE
jgi:hypothetical protein